MKTDARPLVSVVVPTYNRAHLLKETVDSILGQTFSDLELIVVSDGCTDHTEELLKTYRDDRLTFILGEHSGLPAVGRNRGIEQAKGKYIAFCDDDDLWLPRKLEKQVQVMEASEALALCHTECEYFNEEGAVSLGWERHLKNTLTRLFGTRPFFLLLFANVIINSSVVMRASALREVGAFSLDPDLRASEDYDLWLRTASRYPVQVVPEPLVRYRLHEQQINQDLSKALLRWITILRNTRDRVPGNKWIIDVALGFLQRRYSSRTKSRPSTST